VPNTGIPLSCQQSSNVICLCSNLSAIFVNRALAVLCPAFGIYSHEM